MKTMRALEVETSCGIEEVERVGTLEEDAEKLAEKAEEIWRRAGLPEETIKKLKEHLKEKWIQGEKKFAEAVG
jgi:hypothetical protein